MLFSDTQSIENGDLFFCLFFFGRRWDLYIKLWNSCNRLVYSVYCDHFLVFTEKKQTHFLYRLCIWIMPQNKLAQTLWSQYYANSDHLNKSWKTKYFTWYFQTINKKCQFNQYLNMTMKFLNYFTLIIFSEWLNNDIIN